MNCYESIGLWTSGEVPRWGNNPILSKTGDTTAAHQWRCYALLRKLNPDASLALRDAVLGHDAGEGIVGDRPGYLPPSAEHDAAERDARDALWGYESAPLEDLDYIWVRLVDKLDAMMWVTMHAPSIAAGEAFSGFKSKIMADAHKLGCSMEVEGLIAQAEAVTRGMWS
jgi:hypothetical protein